MPRVLVVEDDPATAHRLRVLLESRGVDQVSLATTVARALELLDPPPGWIILDIDLPDDSGLTVLAAVRKATLPTRVVVSSAIRDSGLMGLTLDLGAACIIPKPIDPVLLPIGMIEGG